MACSIVSSLTEGKNPSGRELYLELNKALHADPDIDELGLVVNASPSLFGAPDSKDEPENEDDGPAFILREHKLAVAFWCIAPMFADAVKQLNALRADMTKETTLSAETSQRLQDLTRIVLLVNADHYSAWNVRKKLLLAGLSTVQNELRLLNLVYSKHPKSGEAWCHRRWTLRMLVPFKRVFEARKAVDAAFAASAADGKSTDQASSRTDAAVALLRASDELYKSNEFQGEMAICERTAELYPKNYYAWSHRQWLTELVASSDQLLQELTRTNKWTDTHISDHCGFHQRQVVLLRILRCTAHHFSLAASRLEHSQLPPAAAADPELASARTASKESKSSHSGDSKAGSDLTASSTDAGADADSESKELAKAFAAHRQSMQRAGDGSACACVGCSAWAAEFRYLQSLQLKYPGHETLWLHRRFLFVFWLRMLLQHQPKTDKPSSSPVEWLVAAAEAEAAFADAAMSLKEAQEVAAEKRAGTTYKLWVWDETRKLLRLLSPKADSVAEFAARVHSTTEAAQAVWTNASTVWQDRTATASKS